MQQPWDFLKRAVELEKIPQALLFSGPSAEKRNIALQFIQLVNGQDVKEGHPDLHIVEPEENKEIKISQIRQLQAKLSLKAYSAPLKAAIIDQAHTLNWDAQSAFLKLLEEPKGDSLFILITEYPEQLLSTILSRLERLRFPSVLTPCSQEKEKELLKIRSWDLGQRFQYAKKLAEDPVTLRETLEHWLRYLRGLLMANPDQPSLVKKLRKIQTIHYLISTTNLNPKLALEVLMLEL